MKVESKETSTGTEQIPNDEALKLEIKSKFIFINVSDQTISTLQHQIRKNKEELILFSANVSKIIEKKTLIANKSNSVYNHPNFNPVFKDKGLQILHNKKESIYEEIKKIKGRIARSSSKQSPGIITEIRKKESLMAMISKEFEECVREKEILKMEIGEKKKITRMEDSGIEDWQEKYKEFEETNKQIRELEREVKVMMNEQVYMGMYENMTQKQKEMKRSKSVHENPVDKSNIDELINEINNILESRNLLESIHMTQKEELVKQINDLILKNTDIEKNIRKLANSTLKNELERKRSIFKSAMSAPKLTHKESIESPKKMKSFYQAEKTKESFHEGLVLPIIPISELKNESFRKWEEKTKKKIVENLDEGKILTIGKWIKENEIVDETFLSKKINKALSLKVRTKGNLIIGGGVIYLDTNGAEVMGKSNVWGSSIVERDEKDYEIDLREMVSLEYLKVNDEIGLNFIDKNGTNIQIGEFDHTKNVAIVHFSNNVIKTIHFSLDDTFKAISGIRLEFESPQKKLNENTKIKEKTYAEINEGKVGGKGDNRREGE